MRCRVEARPTWVCIGALGPRYLVFRHLGLQGLGTGKGFETSDVERKGFHALASFAATSVWSTVRVQGTSTTN